MLVLLTQLVPFSRVLGCVGDCASRLCAQVDKIMVALANDVGGNVVSDSQGEQVAKANGMKFFSTTAKEVMLVSAIITLCATAH